ncbi:hypothetical protein [Nocardia sp. NPDC004260]
MATISLPDPAPPVAITASATTRKGRCLHRCGRELGPHSLDAYVELETIFRASA